MADKPPNKRSWDKHSLLLYSPYFPTILEVQDVLDELLTYLTAWELVSYDQYEDFEDHLRDMREQSPLTTGEIVFHWLQDFELQCEDKDLFWKVLARWANDEDVLPHWPRHPL